MIHKVLCPLIAGASKINGSSKLSATLCTGACLVACEYKQVPGVNFFKKYSPVVNDITFCILLLMVLHFGYSAKIVDVETAFLCGNLEVEIYMDFPKGMSDIGKDDCIILNKCIYGLVYAVRQYYKKAIEILKNWRLVGGNVNPCLYVKKSMKGVVYIALYVDDNVMGGDVAAIDETISALKNNTLVLKVMEWLQDYLSWKINFSKDKKRHGWVSPIS